jgi:ferredoxin--NADP+ reductase/benzoate/toluate 1,2-dioxygenase reductase subunit
MISRVRHIRNLSPSTYVLRLDRKGLPFVPGQHIHLGKSGAVDLREYTIYSSPEEDYLEVLITEVEAGSVSRVLRYCEPGDELRLKGPFGLFVMPDEELSGGKFLFVATGSGIAPFHCFVRHHPSLDYILLHGVGRSSECYDRDCYEPARYIDCISREEGGTFHGRVTDYIRRYGADPASRCYLCGNGSMVYETFHLVRDRGVPAESISTEVYF